MERRQFTRVIMPRRVELLLGEQSWISQLHDLSLKGALIHKPKGFNGKQDDGITLNISLNMLSEPITFEGVVSYIGADTLGLICTRMDIDSITELRRIIELNVGNDEMLHRELHSLISDE